MAPTRPDQTSVEGSATYPKSGSCDAVLNWKVRMEYASAAPITFATQGEEIGHGVRFIGESFWVHVVRGSIKASDAALLRDPQNAMGTMPIKLPVGEIHADELHRSHAALAPARSATSTPPCAPTCCRNARPWP